MCSSHLSSCCSSMILTPAAALVNPRAAAPWWRCQCLPRCVQTAQTAPPNPSAALSMPCFPSKPGSLCCGSEKLPQPRNRAFSLLENQELLTPGLWARDSDPDQGWILGCTRSPSRGYTASTEPDWALLTWNTLGELRVSSLEMRRLQGDSSSA